MRLPRLHRWPLFAGTACLAAAALAPAAGATDVQIRFTATTGAGTPGSSSIDVVAGDTVTAVVSVEPDAAGVSNYVLSLEYDAAGLDGLDLVSATELLDPSLQFNLDPGCASTEESAPATAGRVSSCEAVTLGDGPPLPDSIDVAELVFQATPNVTGQSIGLSAGFLEPGVDGMFDNAGEPVAPVFGNATIVPEPGFGAGFLAGLAMLLTVRRRRH